MVRPVLFRCRTGLQLDLRRGRLRSRWHLLRQPVIDKGFGEIRLGILACRRGRSGSAIAGAESIKAERTVVRISFMATSGLGGL